MLFNKLGLNWVFGSTVYIGLAVAVPGLKISASRVFL